jgi:O-antigen ligase
MRISLDTLKVLPGLMMAAFAAQFTISFNVIDMQAAAYALFVLQLLGSVVSCYLIVRQRTFTFNDFVVLFFMVIIGLSSMAHGTDAKMWLLYMTTSVCLLRFTFNFYQHNLSPLIIGLTFGFTLGVFLQMGQLILNPSLWITDENKEIGGYILGDNYNQIGVRLLLALLLNFLCVKIHKLFYLLLVPCAVSCIAITIIVGSMTAATGIIIFLLLCLIPSSSLKRLAIGGLFFAVALFQLLVCFNGNGIEHSETAVWFVEDVLGKDITFTYRTHMWDSALRVIAESPLFGYGFPDKDWYLANMTSFAIGPHNILLATLIYGGIITFGIYLYLLVRSTLNAANVHNFHGDCLTAAIAVSCLMMLMEAYPVPLVFCLFCLAEYYPQLNSQLSTQDES